MSSLRKGAFYLLVGSAGQSVLRVLFGAVLARLLTPEDFGLIATATIVTGFAELFVQFGFGQGLVQKKEINKADVGTAYTSSLVLGLAFGLLLVLIAPLISSFFEQPELTPILRLLSVLFPLKSLNQVQFSILQRGMKFKSLAGRDVLSYAIGYGLLGISLAYLGFGVMALVYALLVQAVVYSILLGISQRDYGSKFSFEKESFIELFSFGKNLTLSKIFNYAALKGDYFIVSKIMGAGPLGFYSRAYGLMNFPHNLVGSVLGTVLFANYSRHQDNRELLTKSIKKSLNMLFFVSGPITISAVLLAKELVLLLLGDKWLSAVLPFQILSLAIVFRIGYKITGTLLKGIGRIREFVFIQLIYCAIVLVGSYIGSLYNISAVAANTGLAVTIMFFMFLGKTVQCTDYTWKEFFGTFFRASLFSFMTLLIPVLTHLFVIDEIDHPMVSLALSVGLIAFFTITLAMNRPLSNLLGYQDLRQELKVFFIKIHILR